MIEIHQRVVQEGGLEEAVELDMTELSIRHIPKEVRQFLEGAHNVEIALLSDIMPIMWTLSSILVLRILHLENRK